MENELTEILKKDPESRYRLKYVDYAEGEWTLPVLLTYYRIKHFVDDESLERVEIIFSNGNKLLLPKEFPQSFIELSQSKRW